MLIVLIVLIVRIRTIRTAVAKKRSGTVGADGSTLNSRQLGVGLKIVPLHSCAEGQPNLWGAGSAT